MAFWQWSKTPASNASADPTINWAEGQSGSSVNDSARAMMSRLSEYRDDTSGLLLDTGNASAYAVTTNQGLSATPNDGQLISLRPAHNNAAGVTLAADGGTAFPIQSIPGTAINNNTMLAGAPYDLIFHAATPCWLLKNIINSNPAFNSTPITGLNLNTTGDLGSVTVTAAQVPPGFTNFFVTGGLAYNFSATFATNNMAVVVYTGAGGTGGELLLMDQNNGIASTAANTPGNSLLIGIRNTNWFLSSAPWTFFIHNFAQQGSALTCSIVLSFFCIN